MGNVSLKIKIKNETSLDLKSVEVTRANMDDFPMNFCFSTVFRDFVVDANSSKTTPVFKFSVKDNSRGVPLGLKLNFCDGSSDEFALNLVWSTGEAFVSKDLELLDCCHLLDFWRVTKDDVHVLKITVEQTEDQLKDVEAEEFFNKGLEELKKERIEGLDDDLEEFEREKFTRAGEFFIDALKTAVSRPLGERIQEELSETLEKLGDNYVTQAFVKDKDDEFDREDVVLQLFLKALRCFENALFYSKMHEERLEKRVELVTLKLQADEEFHEAQYLSELMKKNDAESAVELCGKIFEKYESAREKYTQGVALHKKFNRGLKRVAASLENHQKIAADLKEEKPKIKVIPREEDKIKEWDRISEITSNSLEDDQEAKTSDEESEDFSDDDDDLSLEIDEAMSKRA